MFKQKSDTVDKAGAATPPDAVRQARTRARQRLIGAVVLLVHRRHRLAAGVRVQAEADLDRCADRVVWQGWRPVDRREPGLVTDCAGSVCFNGGGRYCAGSCLFRVEPRLHRRLRPSALLSSGDVITESRSDAGRDVTPRPARAATAASAPKVASIAPRPEAPARKPPDSASSKAAAEAERARALLEGRSVAAATSTAPTAAVPPAPAAAGGQRFIVQVGAFADAASARETRQKAEKLGLKTYTQIANTSSGSRIRVRVGPFASRDAADAAMAKAKSAGLAAVVMTL